MVTTKDALENKAIDQASELLRDDILDLRKTFIEAGENADTVWDKAWDAYWDDIVDLAVEIMVDLQDDLLDQADVRKAQ
jgi:hypothetical protein